jgi:hypothetical protein
MRQCSVINSHTPSTREVLELRAGDTVTVGARDEQWPQWLWCTNERGAGWVPDTFLDIHDNLATAKRAYTTRELKVSADDNVEVLERHGGRAYVRLPDGDLGWIPERCLLPR